MRVSREHLASFRIRHILHPRILIILQRIFDLHLVIALRNARLSIKLSKAAENRSAHAPFARASTAPVITLPAFECRLDQVTRAVAHARPEEKDAVLSLRGWPRDDRCYGMDDGGFRGAKGNAATPDIFAFGDCSLGSGVHGRGEAEGWKEKGGE